MHKETTHTFLPIAVNITNRKIVIVGGGRVGLHKATILRRYTDNATVISPTFRKGFEALPFKLICKVYEPEDISDAFLVYVCTEDEALNRRVKEDAERMGVLTSVCDNPELCDFISPAIYRDDSISIAVTSNAKDVKRSIRIRDRIREWAEKNPDVFK